MKKVFSLMLALAMLMGLMAGCGNGSDTASKAPAESQEEPAVETQAAPAEQDTPAPTGSAAEEGSTLEGPAEKGEFVAPAAELPLADGATLTYFCELPGYMSMFNVNAYDDTDTFKEIEKITGVDIEFTTVNMESYDTNYQLMIASGDFTDMVAGASQQYASTAQMMEDGVAIDLMEYQEYLPNFWNALD